MTPKTFVIIPAAGQGKRFGQMKQFSLLKEEPVYIHTLRVFESHPSISQIHLMLPETEVPQIKDEVYQKGFKKVSVLTGGKERQDSVRLGFEAITTHTNQDIVMVHDAARPFINTNIISASIKAVQEKGACAVGIPVQDTLKKVSAEGEILETIDRSTLWAVQTPQTFRYEVFEKAVRLGKDILGTDECMLVEKLGYPIHMIMGSPLNFKITHPEDMKIAEGLLLCASD